MLTFGRALPASIALIDADRFFRTKHSCFSEKRSVCRTSAPNSILGEDELVHHHRSAGTSPLGGSIVIRVDGGLRSTLSVGDRGRLTKIMSYEDVIAFANASGDHNPVHLDDDYARATIFGGRVVHGVLTAGLISAVLGGVIPGLGTIFYELHIKFLKPVYLGESVTAEAIVTEIINPKRVRLLVAARNEQGEDVALGNALVVPPDHQELLGLS